jgi:hypothetical protein
MFATIDNAVIINHEGIATPGGLQRWEQQQQGPRDMHREQAVHQPHRSFGKLTLVEKLCFAVAAHLRGETDSLPNHSTALILATTSGSVAVDTEFNRSIADGYPSPALFSATLPSSPLTEIAIFHKITGPNRTICQSHGALVAALRSALLLLGHRKASSALLCYEEGCGVDTSTAPFAAGFLLRASAGATFEYATTLPPGDQRASCTALAQNIFGKQTVIIGTSQSADINILHQRTV